LGELRDAASEAQEVANLYSQKMLLLDRQATRANFLRALRQATVVHFAGHAIFASDEPLSSKLILTPGQGSSLGSTISARELAKMDLHHVGLFILSACDTGARGAGRRDGFPGFVDALLGAGVSSVVATQWRMPDQQSRLFFVEFHRIILAGKPADEALRLAQVEAIHGGQSTGFWAALEILGDIQ
jgi:CHAT domain-containing protein